MIQKKIRRKRLLKVKSPYNHKWSTKKRSKLRLILTIKVRVKFKRRRRLLLLNLRILSQLRKQRNCQVWVIHCPFYTMFQVKLSHSCLDPMEFLRLLFMKLLEYVFSSQLVCAAAVVFLLTLPTRHLSSWHQCRSRLLNQQHLVLHRQLALDLLCQRSQE